jgi:hypothetical protein
MIDPPHPTRERDYSLRATTQRLIVTLPRPKWGWIEGRVVTDMAKLRKLTSGLVFNFPDLGARASAANKGVTQENVRFRTFLGVQNRADLCRTVQNRAKGRQKRAKNDQKRRGFATGFIKTCQVLRVVSICNRRLLRNWERTSDQSH